MYKIKNEEIINFTEFMQSNLLAKQLLGEDTDYSTSFKIESKLQFLNVDINHHRVMVQLKLRIDDPDMHKLSGRLKYYLTKLDDKNKTFNHTSKSYSTQNFNFAFSTYNEFTEFYKKYLL